MKTAAVNSEQADLRLSADLFAFNIWKFCLTGAQRSYIYE